MNAHFHNMRNNQLQVTMNDLTEDLSQNLMMLHQNVQSHNNDQMNTNMSLSTQQNQPLTAIAPDSFRNFNQYSGQHLFLNDQTNPSGVVLQGSVNNLHEDRSSSAIKITNFIESTQHLPTSHQALNQKTL